jgi:hypothetical protein
LLLLLLAMLAATALPVCLPVGQCSLLPAAALWPLVLAAARPVHCLVQQPGQLMWPLHQLLHLLPPQLLPPQLLLRQLLAARGGWVWGRRSPWTAPCQRGRW